MSDEKSTSYLQGFREKCAELGVDADELLKFGQAYGTPPVYGGNPVPKTPPATGPRQGAGALERMFGKATDKYYGVPKAPKAPKKPSLLAGKSRMLTKDPARFSKQIAGGPSVE